MIKINKSEIAQEFLMYIKTSPIYSLIFGSLFILSLIIYTHLITTEKYHLSDFIQDYTAGNAALNRISAYSEESKLLFERESGAKSIDNYHPPFCTVLMIPLALLSYSNSFNIYYFLIIASVLFIIFEELKRSVINLKSSIIIVCLIPYTMPFYYGIVTGNLNVFIAVLIIFSLIFIEKKYIYMGGICIGIASLMKIYPLLFVVTFFFSKQYKALNSALTTVLLGTILSIILLGIDEHLYYIKYVIDKNLAVFSTSSGNISISGLIAPFFIKGAWTVPYMENYFLYKICSSLVTIILFVFYVYILKSSSHLSSRPHYQFALTSVFIILLSPTMWEHSVFIGILSLSYLYNKITSHKDIINYKNIDTIMLLFIISIFLITVPIGRISINMYLYYFNYSYISPLFFLIAKNITLGFIIITVILFYLRNRFYESETTPPS